MLLVVSWLRRLFRRDEPEPEPEPPRPVTEQDLAWDDDLYARLARVLDLEAPTPAEVFAAFGQEQSGGPSIAGAPSPDLGYGASYLSLPRAGGTASAAIDLVTFKGQLARLSVGITWQRGRGDPRQLEALRRACGDRLTIRTVDGEDRAEIDRRYPDVDARLVAARAEALGPFPAAEVPPDLRDSFDELVAFRPGSIAVGRVGFAAIPANDPIEPIVKAGRIDLLRAILRGPSPAGRVQAAGALVAGFADRLDDADRRAIRAVRELAIPIFFISGCVGERKLPAELIPPVD